MEALDVETFHISPFLHTLTIAVLTWHELFWLVEHYKQLKSVNLKLRDLLIVYNRRGCGGYMKRINHRNHVSFIFYIIDVPKYFLA